MDGATVDLVFFIHPQKGKASPLVQIDKMRGEKLPVISLNLKSRGGRCGNDPRNFSPAGASRDQLDSITLQIYSLLVKQFFL